MRAFLTENHLDFEKTPLSSSGRRFESQGLTFLQTDFFTLEPKDTGRIDAIFDRAALVALTHDQRSEYARRCAGFHAPEDPSRTAG